MSSEVGRVSRLVWTSTCVAREKWLNPDYQLQAAKGGLINRGAIIPRLPTRLVISDSMGHEKYITVTYPGNK